MDFKGKIVVLYYALGETVTRRRCSNGHLIRMWGLVQDVAQDCGFFYGVQKTRSRSHRLDISIRYTFNAQKSKYKGTGAGQAERQRM